MGGRKNQTCDPSNTVKIRSEVKKNPNVIHVTELNKAYGYEMAFK